MCNDIATIEYILLQRDPDFDGAIADDHGLRTELVYSVHDSIKEMVRNPVITSAMFHDIYVETQISMLIDPFIEEI